MSAREEILGRVRSALADVGPREDPEDVEVPRHYRRDSPLDLPDVTDLFVENVVDYGARVHRVGREGVADCVGEVLAGLGVRSVVVPPGFPESWLPGSAVTVLGDDPPLSPAALDEAGAVVTTAAVGIAETGTIALVAGPGTGRRALSLVPDVHVCVVRTDQVVATVPQALDRLADRRADPITLISGGSATSDIELVRVEGVHGPRTLVVVVVDGTAGQRSGG